MVDLVHEELDPLLEGQVGVGARGQVAVDVLDHHDGGIDDDAEVDRPDRQQVRRLAAEVEHREGEQECQGDVDGDDDRGLDVVHEHEQDRDDERDAEAQVLGHGLGGEVEQFGAVVVGLDLRPGQQPAGCGVVDLRDLGLDVGQGGHRIRVLPHEHDALHPVVIVVTDILEAQGRSRGPLPVGMVIADPTQSRLVAHDHALFAGQLPREEPSSLDHVLHADRLIVDRGDDQAADLLDSPQFLRAEDGGGGGRVLQPQHLVDRVQAAAEQADTPRRHGHLALGEVVAAHRGVGVGQRQLDLAQRDAVAAEAVGVGLDLVAPHRAAEARQVHDPRHPPELALQHPVLQRLDVVERVDLFARSILGDFQDIAEDLARGRLRRDARGHVRRQRLGDRGQAVDHLLPGRIVGILAAVMPGHLQVAQAEQRLAIDLLQAGHAGERHLQGDGDLTLDLLGRSAGEQREHLDDRRRRVGVGFDIDMHEGVEADRREEERPEDDGDRAIERPGDELANHVCLGGQWSVVSSRHKGGRRLASRTETAPSRLLSRSAQIPVNL